MTLLPPNATRLERDLEAVIANRLAAIEVPLNRLWNPDTCPAALLPWLAWALSADQWQSDWTEDQKRAYLRNVFYIHTHKGSIGAVRRLLDSLGFDLRIVEWWEMEPRGSPYTFEIRITPRSGDYERALAIDWQKLLDQAKNVRSHLTKVAMETAVSSSLHAAAASSWGMHLLIEPSLWAGDVSSLQAATSGLADLVETWSSGELPPLSVTAPPTPAAMWYKMAWQQQFDANYLATMEPHFNSSQLWRHTSAPEGVDITKPIIIEARLGNSLTDPVAAAAARAEAADRFLNGYQQNEIRYRGWRDFAKMRDAFGRPLALGVSNEIETPKYAETAAMIDQIKLESAWAKEIGGPTPDKPRDYFNGGMTHLDRADVIVKFVNYNERSAHWADANHHLAWQYTLGKPMWGMAQPVDDFRDNLPTDPETFRLALTILKFSRWGVGWWQSAAAALHLALPAGDPIRVQMEAVVAHWDAVEYEEDTRPMVTLPWSLTHDAAYPSVASNDFLYIKDMCRTACFAGYKVKFVQPGTEMMTYTAYEAFRQSELTSTQRYWHNVVFFDDNRKGDVHEDWTKDKIEDANRTLAPAFADHLQSNFN